MYSFEFYVSFFFAVSNAVQKEFRRSLGRVWQARRKGSAATPMMAPRMQEPAITTASSAAIPNAAQMSAKNGRDTDEG